MGTIVTGTGSNVPERILTNEDIVSMRPERISPEHWTTVDWILDRTGIEKRHISSPEQSSSDLMLPAAQKALIMAQKTPDQLDAIYVTYSFPDCTVPSTSDIFAKKLGAPDRTLAKDVTAQCSGFCWALGEIWDRMRLYPNRFRVVLLVSGDATSKFVDDKDRETFILFGDGAGAIVLEQSEEDDFGILAYIEACDRSRLDCIGVPAGGTALAASHETVNKRQHFMHFGPRGGSPMLKAIVREVPQLCKEVCQLAGIEPSQVNLIIPHQLNRRITASSKKSLTHLGLPEDAFYDENVALYGNCSGSSVPLALDTVCRRGLIKRGDIIQLQSYGAGMKYGAVVLRWTMEKYHG